jgi:quercetin dioxygenase-like cupin family protein
MKSRDDASSGNLAFDGEAQLELTVPRSKSDRERMAMSGETTMQPAYAVKDIETVAEGRDLRARLYTLAPGEVIPCHFHSQVTDRYFCLAGTLRVETRAPDADERIAAGGRYDIAPRIHHRISNGGADDCRFLLLQGIGAYDFNRVAD